MDSSMSVRSVAKKNTYFPRSYPFPIIKDEADESVPFNCIIGHLKDQRVEVTDEENMNLLYTMGFYGKGSLSKSTPQALEEKLKKEFEENKKNKSSWQKDRKSPLLSQNEDAEIEVVECEGDDKEIPTKRRKKDEIEVVLSDSNTNEDSDESNDSTSKVAAASKTGEKEVLVLTFEEAYFLSYAFGCLVVKDKDQPLDLMRLWQRFCELHPAQNFPVMYTAYHHFRSKGWVVKSGLKYGVDFVLYKDGPPFNHSSYAVIVKPVKEKNFRDIKSPGGRPSFTWSDLSAVNRICSHVAKTVMILYVIKPSTISENKISTPYCISQYKVEEVVLNRWVPGENRIEV